MKKYEYVSVAPKGIFMPSLSGHRDIIDDYASRGWRYVGFIPTTMTDAGGIRLMDLIFEREAD